MKSMYDDKQRSETRQQEIRLLVEEECEALEAEQARFEQEAQHRRTPEWERLVEEAANIRILTEEECEVLEQEALHQRIPLEWKALQERYQKPRTLSPEEVAQCMQRAHQRRYQPQKRRLLEQEFGKPGRQEQSDEYEHWLKQQQTTSKQQQEPEPAGVAFELLEDVASVAPIALRSGKGGEGA